MSKEKSLESQYYSPIQVLSPNNDNKTRSKYVDQNFIFDNDQIILQNNNEYHIKESQVDSTLHLTVDDKEILNVNCQEIQENN